MKLDIGITVRAIYKDKFAKMFIDDCNAQAVTLFGGAVR